MNFDEVQDELDFVQPHPKKPVSIRVNSEFERKLHENFTIKSIEYVTISYTDENGEEHIQEWKPPIKSEVEESDKSVFTPEFISKVNDISLELSGKYEEI